MNGGYDPETLMQQYRDWEGQQWQPPTWGQPPTTGATFTRPEGTTDRWQYPGIQQGYLDPYQIPISEYIRRGHVDEPLSRTWGVPYTATVGGDYPALGARTTLGGRTLTLPSPPTAGYDPNIPLPSANFTNVPSPGLYAPAPSPEPTVSFTPRWESIAGTWGEPPGFLEKVIGEAGPFTSEAREYFQQTKMRIEEPGLISGGGGWSPHIGTIDLATSQSEAMIHELTHVWWEEKRQDHDLRRAFVEAVIRYADESQQYEFKPPLGHLAHTYVYGDPNDPNFSEGMKTSAKGSKGYTDTKPFSVNDSYWNDWEMYAGLASGCRGDIRQFPPYLQKFYEGLFNLLPPEAPGYAFEGAYSPIEPEEPGLQSPARVPWLKFGSKFIAPPWRQPTEPEGYEWGYKDLSLEEKALFERLRRQRGQKV